MSSKRCRQNVGSQESGIKCAFCGTLYHVAYYSKIYCDLIPIVQKSEGHFCWKCLECVNEKVPSNIENIIKKSISLLIQSLELKVKEQIRLVDGEVRRCQKLIASLKSTCDKQHQFSYRKQQELELQLCRSNILISGLLISFNIEPFDLVQKICGKLDVTITDSDISQSFLYG